MQRTLLIAGVILVSIVGLFLAVDTVSNGQQFGAPTLPNTGLIATTSPFHGYTLPYQNGSSTPLYIPYSQATSSSLALTGIVSCTQALETDASGNIVCGTDQEGAGGTGSNFTYVTDAGGDFLRPSTSVGLIVNASSTIIGNFRVTGSATTTGLASTDLVSCNTVDTTSTGDFICGTDETGGGGSFGQTWEINADGDLAPTTTIDIVLNGASTSVSGTLDIAGALSASSTAVFGSNVQINNLTSALILTGSGGLLAEYTGIDCTNQFVRDVSALGAGTCETVSLTADITGDLPFANLTQGAAYTILANNTSATADFAAVGTSSIFAEPNWQFITIGGGAYIQPTTSVTAHLTNGFISNASSTVIGDFFVVGGATSTNGLAVTNLTSCDTIDTDSSGNFKCGTDTGGGGDPSVTYNAVGGTTYYQASSTATDNLSWRFNNGFISSASSTVSSILTVGVGLAAQAFDLIVGSTTPTISLFDTDASTNEKNILLGNLDGLFTIATSSDDLTSTSTPALTFDAGVSAGVGIGTSTTDSYALSVNGNILIAPTLTTESGAGSALCIKTNGQIVQDDSPLTACSGASSLTVKEDITKLDPYESLADILAFDPVSYRYKASYSKDNSVHFGFIAEEVDSIDSLLVEKPQTGIWGLKYIEFIPKIIAAIQGQNERINALEKRIEALESQNYMLKNSCFIP